MSLDINAFAEEVGDTFVGAAKDFYADAQDQWETDKAFYEEVKGKYKEATKVYLEAKVSGNTDLADQMTTAMKQYTLAIRATVETARLQLESQAQEQLISVLTGVGKTIGSILGGALLAAL